MARAKPLAGITLLFLLIALRLADWRGKLDEAQRVCGWADSPAAPRLRVRGALGEQGLVGGEVSVPWGPRPVKWPGPIFTGPGVGGPGDRVDLEGRFRCRARAMNPGVLADGVYRWRAPNASLSRPRVVGRGAPGWRSRIRNGWRSWLGRKLEAAPRLRALVTAVWLGEVSALPPWLVEQYREAGLLQLLALSGQHVVCLTLLILGFGRIVAAPLVFRADRRVRLRYRGMCAMVPLLAAAWLCLTAVDNPPIFRALTMVAAMTYLRFRRMECGPVQLVASSAAALILWDPSLVARPGFVLSATATALLGFLILGNARGALKAYLLISLGMPVLFFPLSAFYFSKVAWLAPLATLFVGWFWEIVLLPLGFAIPFAAAVLPAPASVIFVGALARGWDAVLWVHETGSVVEMPYFTALRPTWLELLLFELLVLAFLLGVKNRFFRRSL